MNSDDFPSLGKSSKLTRTSDRSRGNTSCLDSTYSDKLKSHHNENSSKKVHFSHETNSHSFIKLNSFDSHKKLTRPSNSANGSDTHVKIRNEKTYSGSVNIKNINTQNENGGTEENAESDWITVSKNTKTSSNLPKMNNNNNMTLLSKKTNTDNSSSKACNSNKTYPGNGSVSRQHTENIQRPGILNLKDASSHSKTSLKLSENDVRSVGDGKSVKHQNTSKVMSTKNNNLKVHQGVTEDGETKKKKKRKSKVKRQAALQSGKLLVLTQEVHSKILGKIGNSNFQCSSTAAANINDCAEYPELGAKVEIKTKKQQNKHVVNLNKTSTLIDFGINETPGLESIIAESPFLQNVNFKGASDSEPTVSEEDKTVEEQKHIGDPITMSLFDIIKSTKTKREPEKRPEVVDDYKATKVLKKKVIPPAVNPLDSSRPTIKRGKEREKPKAKKPSRMKKLILLERQMKKQSTSGVDAGEHIGVLHEETETDSESDDFTSSIRRLFERETDLFSCVSTVDKTGNCSKTVQQTSKSTTCDSEGKSNPVRDCSTDKTDTKENLLSVTVINGVKDLSAQVVSETEEQMADKYNVESVLQESDADNTIGTRSSQSKFSNEDKKKAAQLMIHTRKFRQYCNHFLSKEIDEAVFSLIDDLARFQDRMHQKDPVKARIRRRLIYGLKEIKRHMKMKKIKCVIIATDIEDIKTEGGLNDSLEEIKSISEAYHVPCIFSLHRYNLGKVCRKSVSVSCVGVFNYEGSEKNFKRIIELREDNKHDYTLLIKKLASDLTDDEVTEIFRVEKVSTDMLRATSQDILRQHYFLHVKEKNPHGPKEIEKINRCTDVSNQGSTLVEGNSETTEGLSQSCDNHISSGGQENNPATEITPLNISNILSKYKIVKD